MRIPRIYHADRLRPGQRVNLQGNAADHLRRVLRLGPGDVLQLFDGQGQEHRTEVIGQSRRGLELQVGDALATCPESPLQSVLLQGICRSQRMDLVIQKATELGVARIVPLACERSVVRLRDERAARRARHWEAIAVAAAEQCGRAWLPTIDPVVSLAQGLENLPAGGMRILLDPLAGAGMAGGTGKHSSATLLIGPEGGLTDEERSLATSASFRGVCLGPRILRTETAAITALALMQFLHGDLNGAAGADQAGRSPAAS